MYESRSKARMRLHAGQPEDVPAGTQRGCDVPKTRLLAVVNPHILRMFKGTFSLDIRVAIFLIVCFGISVSFRYFGFVSVNLGTVRQLTTQSEFDESDIRSCAVMCSLTVAPPTFHAFRPQYS